MDDPDSISLALSDGTKVSALLHVPEDARALYVFAHGAGAGMQHAGMSSLANALAVVNVATLRYQFPYMERGSKRVDSPAVAHAAVRAAVADARRRLPALPLFAGGRSFGGRMTSQAQAISPLDGVRGLVFVAFPLHPAGKPGVERAKHLADVMVPMLFLQGTRDKLAELHLLRSVVEPLAPRAALHLVDDADHSFHVRASSGRTDAEVLLELARTMSMWFFSEGEFTRAT
ncbi:MULTISPECIES: alpha/beta family hydrolase [unclassified Caballeronia]|uniref:alpha/beta hydrolase family protein n=1 Tax=unclassified Caballeronia TaxID=2646786 RepID=UPI002864FCF9|nr:MULTISPECIES: alpha/beta family hydrolase [unclassified Caballeronia]MDR5776446.1 alpha/beta hydrolase [Caballeronia sp. LZ002]MDR5806630.1 alpha/beta hydrolase [Caballeronia sp. LZ001]MDR5851773.1 alpha/beta hydrolase [Caballeronia sp. LZ003]